MFYKNSQNDDTTFLQTSSSSEGCTSRPGLTPLESMVIRWKDAWCSKFDWIEFDFVMGRIFYKIYRHKEGKSTFVATDNINIQISTFQDHGKSAEHGHLTWAIQNKNQTMNKEIAKAY